MGSMTRTACCSWVCVTYVPPISSSREIQLEEVLLSILEQVDRDLFNHEECVNVRGLQ